jgi:putative membrane protein
MQASHPHEHHHEHEHNHQQENLQAWLKTALLAGLGLYFTYNIVSGNLSNYINVRFAWLSYVAAAMFLALGAMSAYSLWSERKHKHKNDESCGPDCDCGHDHNHGMSWGALAVVALPLILGTLVPSRPLGASAVDGTINLNSSTAGAGNTTITTFSINPLERNVLDWLRVFNATSDYSEVSGQPADLTGFVYQEPGFEEGTFMLARFTISCCVADAAAIGLPIAWQGASDLQADSWVRVQGEFEVADFRGDRVPVLRASSIEPIEQPAHPYLYP